MLIAFIWLNYYLRSFYKALVFSSTIALLVELILYLTNNKTEKKATITRQEQIKINYISNQLIFAPKLDVITFFYNTLKLKYCSQKFKDCILIDYHGECAVIAINYSHNPLSLEDISNLYPLTIKHNCTRLFVLCKEYSADIEKLSESMTSVHISLLNENDVYFNLLKPLQSYPDFNIKLDTKTISKRELLNIALNKKRTKGYFWGAVILLLSSLFTPYNLYYVISSSILMLLALFSHFNYKFNKPIKKDLL